MTNFGLHFFCFRMDNAGIDCGSNSHGAGGSFRCKPEIPARYSNTHLAPAADVEENSGWSGPDFLRMETRSYQNRVPLTIGPRNCFTFAPEFLRKV